MNPKYLHDCSQCTFLGTHNEFDLYVCEEGHPTVIARYGNEGHEYKSGLALVGIDEELTEAARIAVSQNLLYHGLQTGRIGGGTVLDNIK